MTKPRYDVMTWVYLESSFNKIYIKGEISRIAVVDTYSNNQIVVEFPVKVSRIAGKNPVVYGTFINDARVALDMANRVCTQLNRESGYAIRRPKNDD